MLLVSLAREPIGASVELGLIGGLSLVKLALAAVVLGAGAALFARERRARARRSSPWSCCAARPSPSGSRARS